MSDIKKFLVEEINKTLNTEISKKKIMESSKNLFEAVNLASQLKKEGKSEEKIKMAEGLIVVAEKQLADRYDELDGDCDCGEEGEGQMFKAQLLSIMNNAQKLYHMVDEEDELEDWIQSKITIAEDYLRAAYGYLTYYNGGEDAEMGDDWDDEDGWDDVDEEEWDGESYDDDGMDVGVPQYDEALDSDVDDDELFESKVDEAEEKWIQKAISKPGQLHKDLGVPQGEKIPLEKLQAASKKMERLVNVQEWL